MLPLMIIPFPITNGALLFRSPPAHFFSDHHRRAAAGGSVFLVGTL
jgi:hypothetical protein